MAQPSAKVRKPYTMTKQREKWSEEEHGKFIEALRLHGRSWRRIEEHIQTKTTVQIRSHAQKFFSKLERESSARLSSCVVQDIDIPPPRPKRKPSHPYPRKAGSTILSYSSGALDKERKLPPVVCSAFTPLRSCVESASDNVFIKNGTNVSFYNRSLPSVVAENERKRGMDGSSQVDGFPNSIKLFGQTFVFPPLGRAGTYISGILPENVQSQKNVSHKPQPVSEVESSDRPTGDQNGAEIAGKIANGVQKRETNLKCSASNAYSMGNSKENGNSSPLSSRVQESVNQGEDYAVDLGKEDQHLQDQNCFTEFKAENAAGSVLESVSNNRIPCFSLEPTSVCHMKSPQRLVTDANNGKKEPGCITCMPSHPNHSLQVHDSPTSTGAAVPFSIPGSSCNCFNNHDTGAATAIAAFTLAAASAWCAVQEAVTPENFHCNKRRNIYTPIAVVASEKPAFLSSICGVKTESPKEQGFNSLFTHKAMKEHSTNGQNTNNFNGKEDELRASIKYEKSAYTRQSSQRDMDSDIASTELDIEDIRLTENHIKMPVCSERESINENCSCSLNNSNTAYDCEWLEDKYNVHYPSKSCCKCEVCKQDNPTFSKLQFCPEDSSSHNSPAREETVNSALVKETQLSDKNKQCSSESGRISRHDSDNISQQEQTKLLTRYLRKRQNPCSIFAEKDTSDEMLQSASCKLHSFGSQVTVDSITLDDECMKESLQAESRDCSKQKQPQISVTVTTESLKGPERYSGVGFVPYQKLLEHGKPRFATYVEVSRGLESRIEVNNLLAELQH